MASDSEIEATLLSLLGQEGVSRTEASLRRYASDALRPTRSFPGAREIVAKPQWVVWPGSVAHVQELARLANQYRVPLIPYGGGSGLMGGALSSNGGIVVDMQRLNRIRRINNDDRAVEAEAGAVLQSVDDALAEHRMMLGHDPWTVPVATVGGTISTNGLGYRGAQYGSMGEQVLGLEVVLPDGTLLTTKPLQKTSVGPQLDHLFIGGEGCFGLITAATLKAFPIPEARRLFAIRFPSFEAGYRSVLAMFATGIVPSCIDYGEQFGVMNAWSDDDELPEPGAEMFLVFEGLREVVDALSNRALALCREQGGTQEDESEAQDFWDTRHDSAVRFKQQRDSTGTAPYLQPRQTGPLVDYIHVALPASRVLEYRSRCMELAEQQGVLIREFGLWNRPELFSVVLADPSGDAERLGNAVDAFLRACQDMGGSMEYVHGVGLRLAHLMAREHGVGLDVLRSIKRTLDPNGIMNPGKLGL